MNQSPCFPILVGLALLGAPLQAEDNHPSLAPGSAAAQDPEALALVRELRAQRPLDETLFYGVLTVRPRFGQRWEIPVKYEVRLDEDSWKAVYETKAAAGRLAEKLIVVHQPGSANQYFYAQAPDLNADPPRAERLPSDQIHRPLAGTHFWLSDLGLEFLHWPDQRLVRDAKITMRSGRPCYVLESRNPNPAENEYARVESWIDREFGGVIYARAYDRSDTRIKEFAIKRVGRDGMMEMEMLDEMTDSRTRLEFQFEKEPPEGN